MNDEQQYYVSRTYPAGLDTVVLANLINPDWGNKLYATEARKVAVKIMADNNSNGVPSVVFLDRDGVTQLRDALSAILMEADLIAKERKEKGMEAEVHYVPRTK